MCGAPESPRTYVEIELTLTEMHRIHESAKVGKERQSINMSESNIRISVQLLDDIAMAKALELELCRSDVKIVGINAMRYILKGGQELVRQASRIPGANDPDTNPR